MDLLSGGNLLKALLEGSFKSELLALQQYLIDNLDDAASVDVVKSDDNGLYLSIKLGEREWCVKPSDIEHKLFLLTNNGSNWSGPYPVNDMLQAFTLESSEGAYRALIIDNDWLNRRRP